MPPKKQAAGASKKTEQKKKDKIIEDKTFGLKNKKGAKQQQYIKNVTQQVKFGGQKSARQLQKEQEDAKLKKKDQKKKEQDELNALFKPVQKVSKGADPKSIVCAFYKQGACSKGDKCKFSHDLTMERKSEKRSLYVDVRDEDLKQDNMENWDEEKLAEVVAKKHGEQNKKQQTSTEIVCKFFLQAIEECKYGWFWVCPNGGDKCMYRHALPPGFVLKKDKKKDAVEEEDTITMEELIEEERAKLGANHPKITLETFLKWKQKKIEEKKKKFEADVKKRKEDFKQGKSLGISGREVFEFKPEMAGDDDEGADDTTYKREEEDEGQEPVNARELTLEALAASATMSDQAGATVATSHERTGETSTSQQDVANNVQIDNSSDSGKNISELNGPLENNEDETNKLDQAAALPVDNTQAAIAAAQSALLDDTGVQIDEQLFTDDVPVDEQLFDAELDNLDEDLETLDLQD